MNLENLSKARLVLALKEIRTMAKDHFAFDEDLFKARDVNALANEGGDTCDWTMVAILADDALNGK